MGHPVSFRSYAAVRRKAPWAGAVLALGLSALGAASADAAIIVTTYRGVVDAGYDQTGIFGAANASLGGMAYTAVYTTDDATPGALAVSFPTVSFIAGGTYNSHRPTPTTATLTVNGHTVSIDGSYRGEVALYRPFADTREVFETLSQELKYSDDFSIETGRFLRFQTISLLGFVPGLAPDFRRNMAYTLPVGDYRQGDFNDMRQNYDTGVVEYSNYARLTLTSITVGPAGASAAVPEPATWAMMLVGFFGMGAAMRRGSPARR